ncbi:class I SAM-dependent methyltransferase [Candidatus Parcubacteria bacterium]|nr:class I SAM-dependent methyltransferase [Candidatus Parcubacteria bacterium]
MELRKKIEQEHYDKQAEKIIESRYKNFNWESGSKAFGPIFCYPLRFLERKIKKIIDEKGRIKFLDYGCGTGINSIYPAKLGAEVYGIDISEKSLIIAKERARRENLEGKIKFLIMDCENLQFDDNFFDIVFNCGTLSCLNKEKAYSEIVRVLKPDGYFLSVDTLGHNPLGNLSRKIKFKKGIRTRQTFENILKMKDIELAKQYFKKTEVYFFIFFTLLAVPLQKLPGFKILLRVLNFLDNLVLKFPFFQKYAFKVVFVFSQPKK